MPVFAVTKASAAVIIALSVTACNQNYLAPDPAACKAAMQAQYVQAAAGQRHSSALPAACKGLPKSQVRLFAGQIRAGR